MDYVKIFSRYFRNCSVLLVIAFGIISIVASGGGGNDDEESTTSDDRELYTFSQGGYTGFAYSSPTLVDNYIYIGTQSWKNVEPAGNYFFKLDSSLNKIWDYSLGSKEARGTATLDEEGNIYFVVEENRPANSTTVPPEVSDNTLYADVEYYLYSLDNQGNFRWSKLINFCSGQYGITMMNPVYGIYDPAIATDNTIYVGGNKFFAFDPDGNEKSSYSSNDSLNMDIRNAPIIDPNDNIYFVGLDTDAVIKVFSLTADCQLRWNYEIQTENDMEHISSLAFSTDYTKVYAAIHDRLYCIETNTGNKIWDFKPDGMTGTFRATPAVDDNNSIYIGTHSDSTCYFYAIKSDGTGLLWENPIGEDMYSSPTLGDDNTVYVGSEYTERGRFHALDKTTGAFKWSSPLSTDVGYSCAAIADDGTLYIATINIEERPGILYAFETDSTGLLANAGSPRFHGGNASTGRRD